MSRSPTAIAREHLRSVNQSAVLAAIHRHGRISRTDLAATLGLSTSAITGLTAPFVEEGLVVEAELGPSSSVGRKPILLEINYDHALVLGMKVTTRGVIGALTNLRAEALATREAPLPGSAVDTVAATVAELARALRADAGVSTGKVVGVGVVLPGVVEPHTGTVRHSPQLGWTAVPFADHLHRVLGLPALVENDVNALAAAQAWFGHGRGHDAFLVVTLGRGVGLGIVIDGAVYRGPAGGAGEFGHVTIAPVGARLLPSAPATLESWLADAALVALAQARVPSLGAQATVEDLTAAADAGVGEAVALLAEAGTLLGIGLANLVNLFAPSLIVLAGEGMRNAPHLVPHAEAAMREHAFGDLGHSTELVTDTWGDDAWARGAAGLAAARALQEAAIPLTAPAAERAGG